MAKIENHFWSVSLLLLGQLVDILPSQQDQRWLSLETYLINPTKAFKYTIKHTPLTNKYTQARVCPGRRPAHFISLHTVCLHVSRSIRIPIRTFERQLIVCRNNQKQYYLVKIILLRKVSSLHHQF